MFLDLRSKIFKYFDTEDSAAADKTTEQNPPEKPNDQNEPSDPFKLIDSEEVELQNIDNFLNTVRSGKTPTAEDVNAPDKNKAGESTGDEKKKDDDEKATGDQGKPGEEDEKTAAAAGDKTPPEDKTKGGKQELVTITDDYIKSQPEEQRQYLTGIKDRKLDSQVLKNYVNAQMLIDKYKQEREAPVELPSTVKPEDAENLRQKYIVSEMRKDYSDIPAEAVEDPEILSAWEAQLQRDNPREFNRYMSKYGDTEKLADSNVKQYYNLKENWEKIAANTLKSDVARFIAKISSKGVTEKDLGLNLAIGDDNKNEYLYNKIIFDEKGNVNPDVVRFVDDIPVLLPGQIYNKLMDMNFDRITDAALQRGVLQGYKNRVGDEPPPSIAGDLTGKGQPAHDSKLNAGEVFSDEEDQSLEDIEKGLSKLRNKIASH